MKLKTINTKLAVAAVLIITVLMTGIAISGVFAYRYLVILPGEEKARLELQEKLAKEEIELKRQKQLGEVWEQTSQETEKERTQQAYSECVSISKDRARESARKKAEIDPSYKEYSDKGFYLKADYEYAYQQCLREKGISE